jgi:hypothetical protein
MKSSSNQELFINHLFILFFNVLVIV